MLADHEQEPREGAATERRGMRNGLVDEVRSELEAHDRRSEMASPEPATTEQAARAREIEEVARDEARRLREAGGATDDDR